MQVLAQSTSTQSDARPAYMHLGYTAAVSPSYLGGLLGMFMVGTVAYCVLLVKLDIPAILIWLLRNLERLCGYRPWGLVAVLLTGVAAAVFIWWG